jgi:hypothetical protein
MLEAGADPGGGGAPGIGYISLYEIMDAESDELRAKRAKEK